MFFRCEDGLNRSLFALFSGNGKIILTSMLYGCEDEMEEDIRYLKEEVKDRYSFETLVEANGKKLYFIVKTREGKLIGQSRMYIYDKNLEIGIKSVLLNITI